MSKIPGRSPIGVLVIGYFKLISAVLLIGLGYKIYQQVGGDPALEVGHIVATLKLDPQNHYIHSFIEAVSGVSRGKLYAISAGTFIYAILYAIEGIGLVLHRRWGEYFTVLMTGSLIPFEAYEVVRKFGGLRLLILTLNVAIVVYLIALVVRAHRLAHGTEPKPEPPGKITVV